MSVPTVIMGDLPSVLRLDPPKMKKPSEWTLDDSDVVAHFLQVYGQVCRSQWNKGEISYTGRGSSFQCKVPPFEDFVFAAVYFRQLTSQKDNLLNEAANRFCRFVDCRIRKCWIREEQKGFATILKGPSEFFPQYSVRDLFDAFLYGASLVHQPLRNFTKHREAFLRIYDNEHRGKVLYALNLSLKMLLNPVGTIYGVIYRDVSHWMHDYKLPLTNVRWHNRLFDVPKSTEMNQESPRA